MNEALWALGRGTGVAALVLLTTSLVLGVLARSGRSVAGLGRFGVQELHRTAALTAVGLVVVHLGSLLLDPYAQLHVVDLVVPFLGADRPLWLGLGTLAVDLLLLVTVVSLLRDRVGPRVFHGVHLATYAVWPLALVHALGLGTDAWTLWMDVLAAGCLVAVAAAGWWRVQPAATDRGQVRVRRELVR